MKASKGLKIALILLIIVLISLISFGGIYIKDKNLVDNIMPEYILGMDLKGERVVHLKVDDSKKATEETTQEEQENTEETAEKEKKLVNDPSVLTAENFELAKKIIEKRLAAAGVTDYIIRQDNENGDIFLQLNEDDRTDTVVSYLSSQGKFQIIDEQTKEVLLDNSSLDSVKVGYSTLETGTQVYLSFNFNKEGKAKLEEISKTYITSTDEEGNEVSKKVAIQVDGTSIVTTVFGQPITDGIIPLSIGSASTSNSEIQQYLYQASGMSIVLDNGVSPIVYKVNENRYIASEITSEMMWLLVIISTVIVAILVVYMIVRYRLTGLVCSIAFIGYIAVLMMLIRFANVTVTLSGLFAIGISVIAYYVCNLLLLNKLYQKRKEDRLSIPSAKEAFKNEYIRLTKVLIPCFIIAIVFCFVNYLPIMSFGMILFWGLLTTALYLVIVTRPLILELM